MFRSLGVYCRRDDGVSGGTGLVGVSGDPEAAGGWAGQWHVVS